MTKDWRDDFDWTDPDDVQLMRDMLPDPNGDQSNGLDTKELGPDNKEACKLMEAQQNLLPYEKKYEEPIVSEPGEFQQIEGVGKDIYGKYSYSVMEYKGKQYFVQVRDYETYQGYNEINNGKIIVGEARKERVQ
jgi:hypothetical protein